MKPTVWIIAGALAVAAVVWFVNEQNKSPIERAAEDIEDAAEELTN